MKTHLDRDKVAAIISIVVPMYNEEANLDMFYQRITEVLVSLKFDYEVVCINDGSKDQTFERLIAVSQKDHHFKVLNLSRNFGKEIALTAGLDYTIGDIVIPLDADLQDPPEVIPLLIEKWKDGYDVVYATRIEREGETWFKRLTANLFYRLISKVAGISIPRNTGDFRLMTRRVVDALKELREHHRFMKGLFAWVGFKQTSILYKREPRFAGTTKWNYWKLWNLALEGITSFSFVPLQIASYLGLVIAFFAFLYGVFIIGTTLLNGSEVPGYPSLMVTVLFLGGIQLFTLGVIGEYIGRIYNESKRRPLYLVQEKYGFNNGDIDTETEIRSYGKTPL